MKTTSKEPSARTRSPHRPLTADRLAAFAGAAPPQHVGEATWIEVIRKMDEVYSDLLQYQVALEEKNAALEETQHFIESVLDSMSDVLVVCDRHGRIQNVNRSLAQLIGMPERGRWSGGRSEIFVPMWFHATWSPPFRCTCPRAPSRTARSDCSRKTVMMSPSRPTARRAMTNTDAWWAWCSSDARSASCAAHLMDTEST